MFTRLTMIALLTPTLAFAASQSCKITVSNNAVINTAAIGFTTPIKHSAENLVQAGSTRVLTTTNPRSFLYVEYLQAGQTEHQGEILRAQMGHTIDCQNGSDVQVTITYSRTTGPHMTITY